mmetsp:Transcript_20541/g.45285  ORF Transcript_20541/g.45285 Transcript_20541/m.45285 type:complete len:364 (-) Transcript_20541:896-1987(-)
MALHGHGGVRDRRQIGGHRVRGVGPDARKLGVARRHQLVDDVRGLLVLPIEVHQVDRLGRPSELDAPNDERLQVHGPTAVGREHHEELLDVHDADLHLDAELNHLGAVRLGHELLQGDESVPVRVQRVVPALELRDVLVLLFQLRLDDRRLVLVRGRHGALDEERRERVRDDRQEEADVAEEEVVVEHAHRLQRVGDVRPVGAAHARDEERVDRGAHAAPPDQQVLLVDVIDRVLQEVGARLHEADAEHEAHREDQAHRPDHGLHAAHHRGDDQAQLLQGPHELEDAEYFEHLHQAENPKLRDVALRLVSLKPGDDAEPRCDHQGGVEHIPSPFFGAEEAVPQDEELQQDLHGVDQIEDELDA